MSLKASVIYLLTIYYNIILINQCVLDKKTINYLEKIWTNFYARVDFYVSMLLRYTVGSGRGDGAANFAELDSDFSEPGKHV